jgi:hypothetical protein
VKDLSVNVQGDSAARGFTRGKPLSFPGRFAQVDMSFLGEAAGRCTDCATDHCASTDAHTCDCSYRRACTGADASTTKRTLTGHTPTAEQCCERQTSDHVSARSALLVWNNFRF